MLSLIAALACASCPRHGTGLRLPTTRVAPGDGSISFALSLLPQRLTVGEQATLSVTVRDPTGAPATSYTGTVTISSSVATLIVPEPYAFTQGDSGTHNFVLIFSGAGPATIQVQGTDGAVAAISTVVQAGVPASIALTGAAAPVFVGVPTAFDIEVRDAFGNRCTDYVGEIDLASTDAFAQLPAATFSAADPGHRTIDQVIFGKTGTQTVTANDSVDSTISGTLEGIAVLPATNATKLFVAGVPALVGAGQPLRLAVIAVDAYGNRVPGYRGTVQLATDDSGAVLGSPHMFDGADEGAFTFAISLSTLGKHSITAADAAAGLNGSLATVEVEAESPASEEEDTFDHFFVGPATADATATQCDLQDVLQANLNGAGPMTVEWRRCPLTADREDDSDYVLIRNGVQDGAPAVAALDLSQPDDGGSLEKLQQVHLGRGDNDELLVSLNYGGSSHHTAWCVLAFLDTGAACLPIPDLIASAGPLLAADEQLSCDDWQLEWGAGEIRLNHGVTSSSSLDCRSADRGLLALSLLRKSNALELGQATRPCSDDACATRVRAAPENGAMVFQKRARPAAAEPIMISTEPKLPIVTLKGSKAVEGEIVKTVCAGGIGYTKHSRYDFSVEVDAESDSPDSCTLDFTQIMQGDQLIANVSSASWFTYCFEVCTDDGKCQKICSPNVPKDSVTTRVVKPVRGTNPSKDDVKQALAGRIETQVVGYHEGFDATDGAFGRHWVQFTQSGAPVFHPRAGFGIMQLDPPEREGNPDDPDGKTRIWHWRMNVDEGVRRYEKCRRRAETYGAKKPVKMTLDQIKVEAYHRYNRGANSHFHRWDAKAKKWKPGSWFYGPLLRCEERVAAGETPCPNRPANPGW